MRRLLLVLAGAALLAPATPLSAQEINARFANIRFGGRMHVQSRYVTVEDQPSSGVFFRRVRFIADVNVTDFFTARLQPEFTGSMGLRDAYVRFNFSDGFRLSMGQFKRAFDGFVLAITPFNFTSIAGNLPTAPALLGNTALWKPSTTALLSNWYTMKLLEAAGMPPGVINFVPGGGPDIGQVALPDGRLGGVHFTGSTGTFQHIWRTIGENIQLRRVARLEAPEGAVGTYIHAGDQIGSLVAIATDGVDVDGGGVAQCAGGGGGTRYVVPGTACIRNERNDDARARR